MLEITVNKKMRHEYRTDIVINIKQSYEFVLQKDSLEIKIPSLYRPIYSFSWILREQSITPGDSEGSTRCIYQQQWLNLKKAIITKTNYLIVFDDLGYTISHKNENVVFSCDFSKFRIPTKEHSNTLLTMIDDILINYPDDGDNLPSSFKYPSEMFPVILCNKINIRGNNKIEISYYRTHNIKFSIVLTYDNFKELRAWFINNIPPTSDNVQVGSKYINLSDNFNLVHIPIKYSDKLQQSVTSVDL